jgi:TRAP-type C4-dicarboxylate transport system substrate-binding protein
VKLGTMTAIALAVSAGIAAAENYTDASTWNDNHAITVNNFTNFAEHVKDASNGEINFEVFHSASLLPPKSTLGGLGDGVAAFAHITGAYMPADLPLDNVLNDLAFIATDPVASGIATTEVKLTNPRIQAEYAKHGVVFGNGYSTSEYIFICKDPLRSIEDIKGRKIRTGGSGQIKMVEHFGGVPVSVPATEMYTGLQRGSVDCALGDPSFLTTSFKLQEVAGAATDISIGTHTSGGNYFDEEFWTGLSIEQRRMLLDELGRSLAELQVDWNARGAAALAEAKSNGVEIIEPSADMVEKMEAFKTAFVEQLAAAAVKDRGVEDPTDIIEAYLAAEAKWKTLLNGIDRTDPEAVAKLVHDELYSKIDEKTYGLN